MSFPFHWRRLTWPNKLMLITASLLLLFILGEQALYRLRPS
jgi:hypothetical protein